MSAKRSIRMKPRPRTRGMTRGTRSARTGWWTTKPARVAAVVCAIVTMIVILVPQSPHAAIGLKKADLTLARGNSTETTEHVTDIPIARNDAALPAVPVQPAADAKVVRATIVGCLERADDSFRLTETVGVNVPKSRSWRSAFLKKRAATIAVRDAAKRVNLADHVGQRVSVTGTLVDREMRVGSLHRVAPSCNSDSKVRI